MSRYVRVMAGSQLLPAIRDGGVSLKAVRIVAGAAGGPKWLVLYHVDRLLASLLEENALGSRHLYFVGSSIGSWRFTALSQPKPREAIETFFHAYMAQRYSPMPTPEEVSNEAMHILDQFLPEERCGDLFTNQRCYLSILTVRHRYIGCSDERVPLFAAVSLLAGLNLARRRWMRPFLVRSLFSDVRSPLPVDFSRDTFDTERLPLTPRNIRHVLLASGAIPLVMKALHTIPDAPTGTYRDGGLVDYHLDLPYRVGDGEIVLFPHYSSRVVPGWFDKSLARRPSCRNMARVLLLCPSKTFIEHLPGGKIPDRTDFARFKGRDGERLTYWERAVELGRRMAEEFAEVVESGAIRRIVEPIGCDETR